VTADYPVYVDGKWRTVPVPTDGGEAIAVPIIAALLFPDETRSRLLLQRREKGLYATKWGEEAMKEQRGPGAGT